MRRREVLAGLQWQRVSSLVDHEFADPALPRAVAEGRGLDFERLEFLGDPVLELSVATGLAHAARSGNPLAADQLARVVARRTDGERLEAVSLRSQLSTLVGFGAGRKRRGDIVEAVAAALFLDGGWAALDPFVVRTGMIPETPPVRPEPSSAPPETADELLTALGRDPDELARARVVGVHTVDTALAWWAYRTMPHRDEAVLSAVVHQRGAKRSLATVANRQPLPHHLGSPEDRLRSWIGAVTLAHGRTAGTHLASRLLNLGLPAPT